MPKKKFLYSKWAKEVAASILQSDLDCGFEVADETPDPEKAHNAIRKLIHQLSMAGDRCREKG